MKKLLVLSLALLLALSLCAPALADSSPTPAPTALLKEPSPEEAEDSLAVYRRFVALCQARGEAILDSAFEDAGTPDNQYSMEPGSVLYLTPLLGVDVTAVPAEGFYYLSINHPSGIPWARHRALWADMMQAIDPELDTARAAQAVERAWTELTAAASGADADTQFQEGGWSYLILKSPDGDYGSTLIAQPFQEIEGLPGSGPFVLNLNLPGEGELLAAEHRANFRSQLEAMGMTLLPDDGSAGGEVDGFIYDIHKVTDVVEWTDLLSPEDGRLLAHYALLKGRYPTVESIGNEERGVLMAALMSVGIPWEEAAALLGTLIEGLAEDPSGGLSSSAEYADGWPLLLRAEEGKLVLLMAAGE